MYFWRFFKASNQLIRVSSQVLAEPFYSLEFTVSFCVWIAVLKVRINWAIITVSNALVAPSLILSLILVSFAFLIFVHTFDAVVYTNIRQLFQGTLFIVYDKHDLAHTFAAISPMGGSVTLFGFALELILVHNRLVGAINFKRLITCMTWWQIWSVGNLLIFAHMRNIKFVLIVVLICRRIPNLTIFIRVQILAL